MSIATKTGDRGTTGLMYNRRVSKTHPRIEAAGATDELNAALGHARATCQDSAFSGHLMAIQKNLIMLMGELATDPGDLLRYIADGFKTVTPHFTADLDALILELESRDISLGGWITPGATAASAALDLARTACRRAERRVVALMEANQLNNDEIVIYLNRLSDLLWLMARWVETVESKRVGQPVAISEPSTRKK